MKEVEVTWGRVAQVWWALAWRGVLYAVVPSLIVGFVAGIYMALNNIPIAPNEWKIRLLGAFIGIGVGIWVTKIILTKSFNTFRIALIAPEAATVEEVEGGRSNSGATSSAP